MKRATKNEGLVAIFDMDETLIQSGLKLEKDTVQTFQRLGIEITPDEARGDWYSTASRYGISKEQFDKEFDKRKSWEDSLRDNEAPLFSDSYATLDELVRNDVRIGILTRSIKEFTDLKISYHDLRKYVGNKVAITQVDKAISPTKDKEAIDLVKSFGKDIETAYFVGDRPEDVLVTQAVKKELGIESKGLYLNRYGRPVPESIKGYKVISSLKEIPEAIFGGQNRA